MNRLIIYLLACCAALPLQAATAPERYRVDWHFTLEAGQDLAQVTLEIADGRPVHEIRFRFDPQRFSDFSATGELSVENGQLTWEPPREGAKLSYFAKITHARDNQNQAQSYDALMTDDWALFRGDRLTPRLRVTTRKDAVATTRLHVRAPADWSVNTGWPLYEAGEDGVATFGIIDPERDFDRPSGWIMAGKLGTRRAYVGKDEDTYFSISAPLNSSADRMSWLTLVSLVYPEIVTAFGSVPEKILLVSGDDPLWRGGLSGPNSFYFHAGRRAVSENGTSPLFHELVHVITRISGENNDDWITEGIAEYYGIELLYRAGGITQDRKTEILAGLAAWGREAPALRTRQSSGAVTARATALFAELDEEIARLSENTSNLDAVTRLLIAERRVSLDDLRAAFEQVTGAASLTLQGLE
ncbi:MAG: hypothetical protein LBE21_04605 [Pseudomonadales bacterium]|jgi:hypothetical protein|nr:hypothetical protein [Pseudomonadales bacterium]